MARTQTGFSLKVFNLRETVKALEQLGVDSQDLKEGFGRISDKVRDTAKQEAPKRTGALAANIRASRRKNAAVVSSSQPRGGRPYHWFVYRGSIHNSPPDRYLARAVAKEIGFVEDAVSEALDEAIRRAGL